jgi:hypothetical protein
LIWHGGFACLRWASSRADCPFLPGQHAFGLPLLSASPDLTFAFFVLELSPQKDKQAKLGHIPITKGLQVRFHCMNVYIIENRSMVIPPSLHPRQECPSVPSTHQYSEAKTCLSEELYRSVRPWHSSPVVPRGKDRIKFSRQTLQECPQVIQISPNVHTDNKHGASI